MGGPLRYHTNGAKRETADPLVEQLRMDRHARGITQQWLAIEMGTSQSAISEAESGEKSPTLS